MKYLNLYFYHSTIFNGNLLYFPNHIFLQILNKYEEEKNNPQRGRRRRSVSQTASGHDTRHSQSKKAKKDNKSNNESKKTKRDKESAGVKNGRPLTRSISLWLSQRN